MPRRLYRGSQPDRRYYGLRSFRWRLKPGRSPFWIIGDESSHRPSSLPSPFTDLPFLPHRYSVVEKVEGVEDCLAVGQKLPDGDERFVLFIKPKVSPLSAAVKDDIKSSIRANLSTRHVPGLIVEVPKIPLTGNGKRLEVRLLTPAFLPSCLSSTPTHSPHTSQVPVKKLINGVKYESLNLASAEDPELLRLFVNHPELALTVKSKL